MNLVTFWENPYNEAMSKLPGPIKFKFGGVSPKMTRGALLISAAVGVNKRKFSSSSGFHNFVCSRAKPNMAGLIEFILGGYVPHDEHYCFY